MRRTKNKERYLKKRRLRAENNLKKDFKDSKQEKINEIKYANKNRNFERALVLLDEYLLEYPEDIYMTIFKSSIYSKIREFDKQRDTILSVLSRNLNNRELSFARQTYARYLKFNKQYDEALDLYIKVLDESNDIELVARRDLTELCIYTKQSIRALKYLNIDGFNNQFLNNLRCEVFMSMEKFRQALKELDRKYVDDGLYLSSEKFDDEVINQDTDYLRGHIYYILKQYDEAELYLEKALSNKKRKEYYLASIDLAKIKIAVGKNDNAISLCEEALKGINKDGKLKRDLKRILSVAHKVNNNYDKALGLYDEESEYEKLDNISIINLYFSRGDFKRAKDELVISDRYDDGTVNFNEYYKAASINYRLGNNKEAKEYIDELLKSSERLKKYNLYIPIKRLELLLKLELNEEIEDRSYFYVEEQIIDYDEQKAIDHIIDHHILNISYSNFNENIVIEDLFYEAKEKLDDAFVIYSDTFDRYIVKYDNIGYNGEKTINQLEVITIPKTKKIITMYPSKNIPNYDLIDEEKTEKKEPKRLSQIEKFNLKYGKK